MKVAHQLPAFALVALSLSACAPQPVKPVAYRATPTQMMNAIARLAPALAVKPLNEPFRVTRRTANELVITTPLKPAGAVAGLFLGGGISNKSASITYYFQPQGNVTFVRSSVDAQGGELYQQRDAIDAMLDKTFARVTLP